MSARTQALPTRTRPHAHTSLISKSPPPPPTLSRCLALFSTPEGRRRRKALLYVFLRHFTATTTRRRSHCRRREHFFYILILKNNNKNNNSIKLELFHLYHFSLLKCFIVRSKNRIILLKWLCVVHRLNQFIEFEFVSDNFLHYFHETVHTQYVLSTHFSLVMMNDIV